MQRKILLSGIFLLFWSLPFVARGDKKPVAEDDFASVRVMQTIEIKLLKNDFAYDDHPFKVFLAYSNHYGTIVKTDSSIFYTPGFATPYIQCTDTILYNIIDLDNNLISDFAQVLIDITNEGFDRLDINEVSCRINAYGLQFWTMDPGSLVFYEVPAGSGKGTIFSQSLWIGGLDNSGGLHLAAERYRQVGADFSSGPVMDPGAYSMDQDVSWHRVWRLTRDEILFHQAHWNESGYMPVRNIADWPANGDTSLGQAESLAPYADMDNDGMYDPLKGDCPLILGDQAVFCVNNDDRAPHGETGGQKLGVEVQTLYYAFAAPDDSALKYTTFAKQHIINRSDVAYHDVYVGHFLDYDLGFFLDDYLHCDTLLESAVCYNGLATDGQGTEGHYGEHPPAQSLTCLNYNMDVFVYFMSWGAIPAMQDPQVDKEYYNYLRGFWKDSTSYTYGGNGYGGEMPVKHVFTGDPVSGTGWTEVDSPLGPGDRRGLISSGPYSLNPGDTIHLDFAFVFARDMTGDNISSVALLKERIAQVRNFYQDFQGINDNGDQISSFRVYPNPCRDYLTISDEMARANGTYHYLIFDVTGKQVDEGQIDPRQASISLGNIPPGFYILKMQGKTKILTARFIKLQP